MHVLLPAALGALLLLLGCTANVEPRPTGEAPLPALVTQHVTATIRREASRLVRLETEHEAFLTTPEHPFATPHSGWIRAGRLVPGDWVLSEKFGAVRLLSVRSEPAARPVPVFNLSVASSHAYFVGTDRVLVHNTNCQPNHSESDEGVSEAREEAGEAREAASESREEAIERMVHERAELNLEIKALTKTTPASPRIAELRAERDKLKVKINNSRKAQRNEQSAAARNHRESREALENPIVAQKTREVEEIQRKLDELKNGEASSSSEQPLDRRNKIAAQEAELKIAKRRLSRAKRNAETRPQPREDALTRASREIEKAQRDLEALEKTVPTSSEHARKLKRETTELKSTLQKAKRSRYNALYQQGLKTRPEQGQQGRGRREILRGAALKAALAAAQAELHELKRKRTDSQDPTVAPGPREAELEKRIREHTYDLEKEAELRELENKLAELEEVVLTPDAPHPGLESKKENLRKLINNNKAAAKNRRNKRRYAQDPDHATRLREYSRVFARRARRSERYVDDPTREPDTIDRLEQEVAELTQAPSSPSRNWRLEYSKHRLEKLKRLAALRLEAERLRGATRRARDRKQRLAETGEDTTSIDEKLAGLEQQRKELVKLIATEQAQDILDGFDDGPRAASSIDPASPIDLEVLDQLLAEILNEQAAHEEQLAQNTVDVDEEVRLITELLAGIPSPAPGEVSEAVARLRRELHDERAQFNDNHFALVNEYAYLSSTLGHDNPAAVLRIAQVQVKMEALRLTWQENTQKRLDETRKLLQDMQRTPRLRDETLEAELAEQIGLLEDELADPPF